MQSYYKTYPHREPTPLFVNCKWKSNERQNLTCSVFKFAAEQSEMEVVLQCKNDVCVGVMSINFTMLCFKWFVSHFTVGVMRLLLSSCISLLIINLLTI